MELLPGPGSAGHEHTLGDVEPRAREKTVAATEDAEEDDGEEDERRAKRRKTSEVVTTMEMRIRTMMIQVWSFVFVSTIHCIADKGGGTHERFCYPLSSRRGFQQDQGKLDSVH